MNNKPRQTSKGSGIFYVLLLLVASGVVYSLFFASKAQEGQSGADAVPEVEVETLQPQAQRVWNEFSGRLAAIDYVELRPRVSGTITEVKFEDGQTVKQGEVLFVIDVRPFEAAVADAKAALTAAQSQAELARLELKRAKPLAAKNNLSQSVLDARRRDYQTALAQLEAAKARLQRAELDLDFAHIKAPIDGRVGRAELTEGNVVQAGLNAPLLTTIVSHQQIYAEFEVDEQSYLRTIRRSKEGSMPVEMTLAGEDSTVYKGRIHSFDNQLDAGSGTLRARAIFDNSDGRLIPGLYADIRLGSPTMQSLLLLNEKAIMTDQDKKYVYALDGDGKVAYRQVTLGRSINGQRVVREGLEAGDTVLVNSLQRVRPGMPVTAKSESAETSEEDKDTPSGVIVGEADQAGESGE